MEYFIYSAFVLIILFVIGAPITLLVLPKDLRRNFMVLSPIFGYCYIVFIGYYIYRANIGGVNSYYWYLFALPIVLYAYIAYLYFICKSDIGKLIDKNILIAFGLIVISWFTFSLIYFILGNPFVSLSVSNLDIAELSIVSRFLQEFPRNTSLGFMGQTNWLVFESDAIWFGPSMIVAFICSILKTEPYKLQTMITFILAAQGAGLAYLFINQIPGMRRNISLPISLLYSVSPIIIYTAWQSFGAQSISIPIILTIFYFYFILINTKNTIIKNIKLLLLPLVILFSGLLVTYHYIAVIVLALFGTHILTLLILDRSFKIFINRSIFIFILILMTALSNPLRIIAIFETLAMLAGNAGWFIPWIDPISQIGLNAGSIFIGGYSPLFNNLFIYPLGLIFLLLIAYSITKNTENKISLQGFFYGLFLPLIFSSIYFGLVGHQGDQIGGYKSFKITSIFCFITSITFVLPLTFDIFQNKIKLRIIYYSVILSIFISSLYSLSLILSNHKDSIYILPPSVVDLNIIEGMNEVNGINILDMGNFTNLWANYFLLKKPHIFQAFPYSGRVVGAPIYPYTLLSNTTKLVPSSVSNSIFKSAHLEGQINIKKRINEVFQVADSTAGGGIVLTPGIGWWGAEPAHNWSGKDGRVAEVILDIQNPIFITISADFAGLREGENIVLKLDNEPIDISLSKTSFHSKSLKVERGRHTISMISSLDPAGPFPHDGRTLGILWTLFSVEQVLPPEN